jgi:hypothetical protein
MPDAGILMKKTRGWGSAAGMLFGIRCDAPFDGIPLIGAYFTLFY